MIKDFLGNPSAVDKSSLFGISQFQNRINEKRGAFSLEKRLVLHQVLQSQLSHLVLSEKQQKNLESLKTENTFTITTGHQLNLFTGPVFFIYKILQTIKTAEYLKSQFPDCQFVPMFWLASEDHDFQEINHFRTEQNFYELNENFGGAVGRIKVEQPSFIKDFEDEFKDTVFGTELVRWMKEAYAKGNTLAEATKILVNYLFADYGLLMIDGDNHLLKSEMVPVFKDELLHESLKKTTEKEVQFLTERYGKVQVNPRDINLFYLSETRNRIERKGEDFVVLDTSFKFTRDEIVEELENHPERFSPNALMRPVYQETILPNLAYIGGNAEIMYWLELKNYFKEIELPFPILIPRNSILFIKEKSLKKIEKLGLSIENLFQGLAQVIQSKLVDNHAINQLIEDNRTILKDNFENLKQQAFLTDQSFRNLVEAEETRQLKSFDRMQKRLLRAEKIKQRETVERIENLFLDVHPGGNWQERVYNFSVFYAENGGAWLDYCYQNLDVENSELIISSI